MSEVSSPSHGAPLAAEALVLYSVAEGVATITLNRPSALNAWIPEMGTALLAHVRDVGADPSVRALLIGARGRAFSAGGDVKRDRVLTLEGHADISTELQTIYNPIIREIRELPKPVVAAVHGAAAGIGASLALACDQIVASDDAYLMLAFVRVGLSPDGAAIKHLAERIGMGRATRLAMLGDKLPANTALAWGAFDLVVPTAELSSAAWAEARRLADGPTVALGSIKQLRNGASSRSLAQQLALEAAVQQRHATTADYAEAREAFRSKRPAQFQGL